MWYADDSAAGGKLTQIVKWWNDLQQQGPIYGYHPKPSKTWLIVKPEYLNKAKELFPSEINITTTGHRYLGSFIGNQEGLQTFINGEIKEWKKDISGLASIAANDPHLAYSAFVYGTSKRWSFVSRTTPDISGLFNPLEYHIKEEFIPAITGKLHIPDNIRRIFSLPAKMGGMGISNASETSDMEYNNSIKATLALTEALFNQADCYNENVDEQASILSSIKRTREEFFKKERVNIVDGLSPTSVRQLDLISEKGASCWLTSLPMEHYGFTLNRQDFHDAISLRYNLTLSTLNRSGLCPCGEPNTINHCLVCKIGGFISLRHNSLRDTTEELLKDVCKDVENEPHLLPVQGIQLPAGTNLKDGARLDVSARSFWSPLDRAFVDIRVLHPQAQSNSNKTIKQMYQSHERSKKTEYNARVLQVEKASFTPLVFSTSGGMGEEAIRFYKRVADKMSRKTGQRYSDTITFIRRRLRFDLLRTCLISIRGYIGKKHTPDAIENLDLNLRPQAY